ncbi:MAG: hypothetical protein NZ556_07460 [Fimbriimonadales bacterium]|nr:hypothetical protein [Fimbriimonadales bacterium]
MRTPDSEPPERVRDPIPPPPRNGEVDNPETPTQRRHPLEGFSYA